MTKKVEGLTFRKVSVDDAKKLMEIYRPYVEDTAVSFEVEMPTEEAFKERIRKFSSMYPYIVCENVDGEILGYALAIPLKAREAYNWAAEVVIYVDINLKGQGVGKRLYTRLEKSLRQMGIINTYASVVRAEKEDPYITDESYQFHKRMGYHDIGNFHNVGYKFGNWYDLIWMGKMLGKHTSDIKPVKFGEWDIVEDWV